MKTTHHPRPLTSVTESAALALLHARGWTVSPAAHLSRAPGFSGLIDGVGRIVSPAGVEVSSWQAQLLVEGDRMSIEVVVRSPESTDRLASPVEFIPRIIDRWQGVPTTVAEQMAEIEAIIHPAARAGRITWR